MQVGTLPDGGRSGIEPREVYDRIQEGESVTILDTRRPSDFEEWHIDGPTVEIANVPKSEFEGDIDPDLIESLPEGSPLLVVCAKGISSAEIAATLRDRGIDATNMALGMEGWARVFVAREIREYDGTGTLWQYHRPSSGCLSYMLVHEGEAAVFDPLRAFTDRYRSDVAGHGAALVAAFDTHVHADHFSGVRQLAADGTMGVLPEPAIERGVTYADEIHAAADGETFSVGEATVTAVHTPGHTTGMTSYLLDEATLLTGDGLFVDSLARPDLEAGDDGAPEAAGTLYDSLHEVILTYPEDLLVAGGHVSDAAEPTQDGTFTATLGELKDSMAVLSLDRDAFVEHVLADFPPRPSNYRTIIGANLGKTTVSEEDAFQLELGPNNCATSTETLRAS